VKTILRNCAKAVLHCRGTFNAMNIKDGISIAPEFTKVKRK